jgi:hypothetical protein
LFEKVLKQGRAIGHHAFVGMKTRASGTSIVESEQHGQA